MYLDVPIIGDRLTSKGTQKKINNQRDSTLLTNL
jgi:hypothetical protein